MSRTDLPTWYIKSKHSGGKRCHAADSLMHERYSDIQNGNAEMPPNGSRLDTMKSGGKQIQLVLKGKGRCQADLLTEDTENV